MRKILAIFTAVLAACSSTPGYRIKDDGVYFVSRNGIVAPVKGANPKSFQILPLAYGRDGEHFYRAWEPLEGAYLSSFKAEEPGAQEGNALYSKTGWLLICDYPTFHDLNRDWHADSKCVYWHSLVVQDSDPTTFQPLGELFGKDRNHVYFANDVIASADPTTFMRMCGSSEVNGKDNKHCYWYDHEVACDCKPHSELEFRKRGN